MAFIPVEDVAKLVMGGTLNGVSVSNTFWFYRAAGWSAISLGDLNDWAIDAWTEFLLPIQNSAVTMVQAQSYDMQNSFGATIITAFPGSTVGGVTATPSLPPNVTLAVKLATAQRGRSGRGRVYFYGLSEGDVSGKTMTGSGAAVVAQAYEDFCTLISTSMTATHGIVSFYTNGAARPEGLFQVVTSYTADSRVDTQRRRLG